MSVTDYPEGCDGCKPMGTAVHYGSCPLGLEEQQRRADRIAELETAVLVMQAEVDEHDGDAEALRAKVAALEKALVADAAYIKAIEDNQKWASMGGGGGTNRTPNHAMTRLRDECRRLRAEVMG